MNVMKASAPKRKRRVFWAGMGLLLLPACLSWFLEKPTFTLKEVVVSRLALPEAHFLFGIEVQNPNSFGLRLRGLEYTVYFNDQEMGRGRLEKEVEIPKSASALVQVPLQANLRSVGSLLGTVFMNQNLRYRIEGAAVIQTAFGTGTVPFNKTGEINLKK